MSLFCNENDEDYDDTFDDMTRKTFTMTVWTHGNDDEEQLRQQDEVPNVQFISGKESLCS
jgi:hypothetical protein